MSPSRRPASDEYKKEDEIGDHNESAYEIHGYFLFPLLLFHIAKHSLELFLLILFIRALLRFFPHQLMGRRWSQINRSSVESRVVDRFWCWRCGICIRSKRVLGERDDLLLPLLERRVEKWFARRHLALIVDVDDQELELV